MDFLEGFMLTLGLDISSLKKGQQEATASTAKMAADVTKSAGAAEKAQTGSNDAVVASIGKLLGAVGKAQAQIQHNLKETVAVTKSTTDQFNGLARGALTLFAIFAGFRSVEDFTKQIVDLDASVGRLAHSMGSTPEALSAIGRSVELVGGSFSGATAGLQGFLDQFEALRAGNGADYLKPIAQLEQYGGKAISIGKDWRKSLHEIGDDLLAIDKKGDPAMADYLGRQVLHDPGLVNWARRGSAAMQADEARAPKITAEEAANAAKMQASLAAMKQDFTGIGEAILLDFGPAIITALKWVKDLVDAHKALIELKVKEWVKEIGDWFQAHGEDVKAFAKEIGDLITTVAGIAVAFAKQSPMMQALELFALTMGGTVLRSVSLVTDAIRALALLPVPAVLTALAGVAGAKVLADNTIDPNRNWADESLGERVTRNLDEGLADRMYGKRGEQQVHGPHHGVGVSANHDRRNLWQKTMPKWIGGKDAPGAGADPEVADYIARAAAARGIDPRVALGVAKTEGLNGYDPSKPDRGGDKGTSFGPYQLHYKSNIPGFTNAGMGDDFTRATGKDARDSSTWKDQVDFALDHAAKHGWSNWHGWKGPSNAGLNMDPAEAAKLVPQQTQASADKARPVVVPAPQGQKDVRQISGDLSAQASYSHGQLEETKGLIFHHTGGGGTPEGVVSTLNQRGLGVQYVMDRNGKIFRTLPEGARGAHILRSEINDLSNANTRGVEVIAKDDKDVTPAQIASGRAFGEAMAKQYPGLQIFGHGEVNPSHKQADEGHSIVAAIRADIGKSEVDPNYKPAPIPMGQRNLATYIGRDPVKALGNAIVSPAEAKEAPTPTPTVGDAGNSLLKAYRESQHRGPTGPVKVEMTDQNASKVGRQFGHEMLSHRVSGALGEHVKAMNRKLFDNSAGIDVHPSILHAARDTQRMHMASAAAYHTVNSNNTTSHDTKISAIHVHTQATDGAGIAADLRPHIERGDGVARGDTALA